MRPSLPTDAVERNRFPMADGLLDYFPNALALVAELSLIGNQQHNPGEPMHHSRDKSTDHANKIIKHLVDRGKVDADGVLHDVKVAWRALALAQETAERIYGYPMPRNARITVAAQPAPASTGPAPPPPDSADAFVDALLPPGTPPLEAGD
jgi:hypothetical protein